MKHWALLALMLPATAAAGPFTATDVAGGPVEIDIQFTWPDFGGYSGTSTFAFRTATLSGGLTNAICADASFSDYCFEGQFRTGNKGYGDYRSNVQLDEASCINGAEIGWDAGGFFFQRTRTCDVHQTVKATFTDTGITYTFEANVGQIVYTQVRSGPFRHRRGGAQTPTAVLTTTVPPATFDNGGMSGVTVDDNPISGTFVEI